jgi:hypothetical protein
VATATEVPTEVRWSYSWAVISQYEIEPKRIVFRVSEHPVKSPETQTVVLRIATGAAAVPIAAVECDASWLRIARDPADSSGASRISVEPVPRKLPDRSTYAEVRVFLDDPVERCLVVPCSLLREPGSGGQKGSFSDCNDSHLPQRSGS